MKTAFGDWQFDSESGLLSRNGRETPLPPRVAGVLAALVERPGQVVTKKALMDAVWRDACVTEGSLLEAVSTLREALGDDSQRPAYVQTVHRRGYRFIAPVEHQQITHRQINRQIAKSPNRQIVLAAAGVVALVAIGWLLARPPVSASRPVARFVVPLPQQAVLDPLHPSVAISSDGTRLAYASIARGTSRIFVRPMDRIESTPVDGTDGGTDPFFSPDGRWLGFFAHGWLKKKRLDSGEPPIALCEALNDFGANWGADGTIVFASHLAGGLLAVRESGGAPVPVVNVTGTDDVRYVWPQVLPNGRDVFFIAQGRDSSRLMAASLVSGERHVVMDHVSFGRYSPSGHLVIAREDRLEAAAYDVDRGTILDAPRTLVAGVMISGVTGAAQFAFSTNGSLVYAPESVPDDSAIADAAREDSNPLRLTSRTLFDALLPSRFNQFPTSWAPDGQVITFTELNADTGADIWLLSLPDRRTRPFLRTRFDETTARFSADGRWIAYSSNESSDWAVYVQPFPGPGPRVRLDVPGARSPYWSGDGRRLFFSTPEGLMSAAVEKGARPAFGTPALAAAFASAHELRIVLEWDKLVR